MDIPKCIISKLKTPLHSEILNSSKLSSSLKKYILGLIYSHPFMLCMAISLLYGAY